MAFALTALSRLFISALQNNFFMRLRPLGWVLVGAVAGLVLYSLSGVVFFGIEWVHVNWSFLPGWFTSANPLAWIIFIPAALLVYVLVGAVIRLGQVLIVGLLSAAQVGLLNRTGLKDESKRRYLNFISRHGFTPVYLIDGVAAILFANLILDHGTAHSELGSFVAQGNYLALGAIIVLIADAIMPVSVI